MRIALIAAFAMLIAYGCQPPAEEKPAVPTTDKTRVEPPSAKISVPFEEAAKARGMNVEELPVIEMEVRGKGKVRIVVAPEVAPTTVEQVIRLVEEGFYDGQAIHRVEDWVVQWGDPGSKDYEKNKGMLGTGGSGSQLPFEDNDIAQTRGVLAMARAARAPNGDSQVYVLKVDKPGLNRQYVAFGLVIEGMDILDQAAPGDKITMKVVRK